ncbi:MAG TPA: bile acid:sodium symporter family protein, partial [Ferruginibacter sp.]|nr:bile acid:sodium symporter family protein [Ferruginibacter sp.]
MKKLNKIFLLVSSIAAIGLLIGIALQEPQIYKPLALVTAISLAIGFAAVPSLKGYQYTAWIISAVVAGMLFPEAFKSWGGVNLRDKTLILV